MAPGTIWRVIIFLFGVVELPGRANEKSLSKPERALIGDWYEGGKVERPCWITGTDNALFVIPNNKFASRAGLCADGTLFAANFKNEWPRTAGVFGGPRFHAGCQSNRHAW